MAEEQQPPGLTAGPPTAASFDLAVAILRYHLPSNPRIPEGAYITVDPQAAIPLSRALDRWRADLLEQIERKLAGARR